MDFFTNDVNELPLVMGGPHLLQAELDNCKDLMKSEIRSAVDGNSSNSVSVKSPSASPLLALTEEFSSSSSWSSDASALRMLDGVTEKAISLALLLEDCPMSPIFLKCPSQAFR